MILGWTPVPSAVPHGLPEVIAVDVYAAGLAVTEGFDQDVLGRVVEAAGPLNHRLPSSARVAAVNDATKSGQRSVHSGLVSNLTTMKIIAAQGTRAGHVHSILPLCAHDKR